LLDNFAPSLADFGFLHFEPKVGTFTGSFSNARENRITAVRTRNPSDQLLENNRLSETCTTKETSFTTPYERREQVNNFNAGFEHFGVGGKFRNRGGLSVNRPTIRGLYITALIDWFSENVEHPAEISFTDRNRNWFSGVDAIKASHKTVSATESHAANPASAEVLLDFPGQVDFYTLLIAGNVHRVIDRGEAVLCEFGVERRTDNLTDFTNAFAGRDAHVLLCRKFATSDLESSLNSFDESDADATDVDVMSVGD